MTSLLEAALAKPVTVSRANGTTKQAGNKVLAALLVELVTTGSATLPSGKTLEAAPKDWIETVKWIYTHVDGPPRQELELTGALEFVKGYTQVTPDAWDEDTTEDAQG